VLKMLFCGSAISGSVWNSVGISVWSSVRDCVRNGVFDSILLSVKETKKIK